MTLSLRAETHELLFEIQRLDLSKALSRFDSSEVDKLTPRRSTYVPDG
jgi:hypothetical protein